MKDKLLLLLVGCVAAFGAWAYWHYSGEYRFTLFNLIVFISLFLENRNLRKQLNELKKVTEKEA
jgi:hypothetical protein